MSAQSMFAGLVCTALLGGAGCSAAVPPAGAPMPSAEALEGAQDPRVGLAPGWMDAEQAAENLEMIAHHPRPAGFVNPASPGDFGVINTDMAFRDELVFLGSYNGFQIYDISNPSEPRLRATHICPGGQGDLSIYGDLLFMSVEETRGRLDCGIQGVPEAESPDRFRGVRIFDVSNLDAPVQVGAVQTCRGSHTHTLVPDPDDAGNVYIYVSGTSAVRPVAELEGCSGLPPEEDPNTAYFRIEVIQVPLAAPQDARIVNRPRIFADPETGAIAGLWPGGEHGPETQRTSQTNQCHDITAYPEFGLAAGACSGNGILLDISDPANPVRTDEVVDPNFAYWHSATFNNDASAVLFTDEWGGGTAPRCRVTDRPEWGANAIFHLQGGDLTHAGYYKLPAPQTAQENCVAHNGSLIPVPGRDIKVQAWYQGGISVFDFTDAENPVEIAYFDRGPISPTELILGGYWSSYWYNGYIYGSEIARGLDVFRLQPSEHLSQNEIDAAKLVRFNRFNPQTQPHFEWPASITVVRAYLDQLSRDPSVSDSWTASVAAELDRAAGLQGSARSAALSALASQLDQDAARVPDADRVRAMAEAVRKLATS